MFYQKIYIDFFKENIKLFIPYILVIIFLFPMEGLVLPNLYSSLFDKIKNNISLEDPYDFFTNIMNYNVAGLMLLITLTWLIVIFTDYIKGELEADISPKYMNYVRDLLFEGTINKHDDGNFKDVKPGEYISRMMELSRNLRDSFQYSFSRFIPELLVTVLIVLYFLYKDTKIGLIILTSFTICVFIFIHYAKILLEKIENSQKFFIQNVNENLSNSFNNLMNVYITNTAGETVDKTNNLEKENAEHFSNIMHTENKAILISQIITVLTYGIAIYYVYKGLKEKRLSTTTVIAFVLLLGQYLSYVMDLNWGAIHNIIYKFGIVLASKEHIEDVLSHLDRDKEEYEFEKNNVEYKNMYFKYEEDSEEYLFKNFSLKIKDNEKIGIVGRSGTGKTTLMKMLINLHTPEKGEILIDNKNIADISKKSLRNHVNYVNQKTNLFNDTLMYNLKYGNEKSELEIEKILKSYKLEEIYSELNDGYETEVGINGGNLSGGMQKVTTLVRSILKPCGIIIFDEPLAGLDEKTRKKVMKMIFNECKDKTIIIITHDKEILPYLDRVININEIQDKSK